MMTQEIAVQLHTQMRNTQVGLASITVERFKKGSRDFVIRATTLEGEKLMFANPSEYTDSRFYVPTRPLRDEVRLSQSRVDRAKKEFERRTRQIVADLRRCADETERNLDRHVRGDEWATEASWVARTAQHNVLWMVPNLGLDYLPEAAFEVTRATEQLAAAERELAAAESK